MAPRAVRCFVACLAGFILTLCASTGLANEQNDRRVLMGLRLFPAIVAADQELAKKRSGNDALSIVLLYREDAVAAENAARRLATTGKIKNFPLAIRMVSYDQLNTLTTDPPAAIFLVEWSPGDLEGVVRFGITHQRIVFSPFKGDVRAGASAGIFISDRMLPLINRKTLDAAGIRLQPFLLDVAKTNE